MTKSLILAGGCFWCVEHDLKSIVGVDSVISGYSGGETSSPTYENHSGHYEAVQIEYQPEVTSYKKILQVFLDHIDPTDAGGQFADRGNSYLPIIFYESETEKSVAESLLLELEQSQIYEKPIVVKIESRKVFYQAEDYHQNYAEKNPVQYGLYAQGSGRKSFTEKVCKIREKKQIIWKD